MSNVDLNVKSRVHIVGIGGAGMSAIALILAGKGHTVSGSDSAESATLDILRSASITVSTTHDAANVKDVDFVTHSTAVPATNPELVAAAEAQIPVLTRAQTLSLLTKQSKTIAIAGTHGKTTTTSLLTVCMQAGGVDPSYLVGGIVKDLGVGARVGAGEHLVVEADESDGTFLELDVYGSILTNVEADHLEHYGNFDNLKEAFGQFIQLGSGPKIVCLDDEGCRQTLKYLPASTQVQTYGTSEEAVWQITNLSTDVTGVSFTVTGPGEAINVKLPQPGLHNALNATAALVMSIMLGLDANLVADALGSFGGVGRRWDAKGQVNGILFIDDYAHLPTEVKAALAAGRSTSPKRLVAVFQPHRYSRTEQLWNTFGDAFVDADVLIVTGIYSSGEEPRPGVTGKLIADKFLEQNPNADVRYVEELADVKDLMVAELKEGDLCITLGAGDLTKVPDAVIGEIEASNG